MIKMTYADWVYEYERCYDILEESGIHFYSVIMQMLELMYPDFYSAWIDEDIDFLEPEGVVNEIK